MDETKTLMLAHCPFCGYDKIDRMDIAWIPDHPKRIWSYAMACPECKAQGPLVSYGVTAIPKEIEACKNKAIELWNKRGASDGN